MTQQRLKELLSYDNTTGQFTKLQGHINRKLGTIDHDGYLRITLDKKAYRAHRLAWLYVYGEMPKGVIDHINHNKTDNSIDNLRDVELITNSRNMQKHIKCKSGVLGVRWDKRVNKWQARISVNNKDIYLGFYTDFQDAWDARKKAEIQYNFHNTHGEPEPNWEYIHDISCG